MTSHRQHTAELCSPLLLGISPGQGSIPAAGWQPACVVGIYPTAPAWRTDIRAPDLVGPNHGNVAQQVGIDLVLRVRAAGVGARRHPGQPHRPHQLLYTFSIDGVAHFPEKDDHPAAAVEGGRVNSSSIKWLCSRSLSSTGLVLPCIDRGAGYPGQGALLDDGNRISSIDPRLSDHGRLIPDFF